MATTMKSLPLEERKRKAAAVLERDKVPIVIDFGKRAIPGVDIAERLVTMPRTALMQHAVEYIRRKCLHIRDPSVGVFFFVGNNLVPMHEELGRVYDQSKDVDGFLYITCNAEATFGCS
eukprot:PhM_4_TR3487/c0_g1_i1/m.14764/K08341/GABARAP, ATG8, LC3; GABA(A) receptor-associated protein